LLDKTVPTAYTVQLLQWVEVAACFLSDVWNSLGSAAITIVYMQTVADPEDRARGRGRLQGAMPQTGVQGQSRRWTGAVLGQNIRGAGPSPHFPFLFPFPSLFPSPSSPTLPSEAGPFKYSQGVSGVL